MYNVENIVETNLKVALRFLADSNLLEKLDFQGSTTLHNLVKYKDVKLINKFLSNTMDHIQAGNQVSTRNQFQESIYHTAVRYSNYEFIRQFLTDNSIHLIDKNSHVPFLSVHYSTDRKSVSEIFKIFTCFNKYREKEKTPTDLYGNNLMHLAIQSKNLYVYDALMKTEWASIMAAEINSNEDTPLTQAYKTMVIDVYSRSKNEMNFSAKDFFWHIFNWHGIVWKNVIFFVTLNVKNQLMSALNLIKLNTFGMSCRGFFADVSFFSIFDNDKGFSHFSTLCIVTPGSTSWSKCIKTTG